MPSAGTCPSGPSLTENWRGEAGAGLLSEDVRACRHSAFCKCSSCWEPPERVQRLCDPL